MQAIQTPALTRRSQAKSLARPAERRSASWGSAAYRRLNQPRRALNRLTQKTLANGIVIAYQYDDANPLTAIIYTKADGSGATTSQYAYSPYGEVQSSGETTNALQYTGRENDNTGLDYYRARYYDPQLKRFISSEVGREFRVRTIAG